MAFNYTHSSGCMCWYIILIVSVAYGSSLNASKPLINGCAPMNSTCGYENYHNTVFFPNVDHSILLQKYEEASSTISTALAFNRECGQILKEITCKRVFRPCSSIGPLSPCLSLCERAQVACAELFHLEPDRRINCTDVSVANATLVPDFSQGTCNNMSIALQQGDCRYPFTYDFSAGEGDPPCTLLCPLPEKSKCNDHYWAEYLLIPISFILGLYAVLTFSTSKKRRKFPLNLHIFAMSFALMVPIPHIFIFFLSREDMLCENKWTYRNTFNNANALCIIQGIIVYVGGLAGLLYWACLGLTMALTLFKLNVKAWTKPIKFCFYIGPGLIGLALVILNLAFVNFRSHPTCVGFCYVSFLPEDAGILSVTIIVVGIACFTNIINVCYISYVIYESYKRLSTLSPEKKKKSTKFIRAQIGMWVYLVGILWIALVVMFGGAQGISKSEEALQQEIGQWADCTARRNDCGDFPSIFPRSTSLAIVIGLNSTGIVSFLSALAMPQFFRWTKRNWYFLTCRLHLWKNRSSDNVSSTGKVTPPQVGKVESKTSVNTEGTNSTPLASV